MSGFNIEDFRVNPNDFVKDDTKNVILSGYGSVTFVVQKETNVRCAVKKTNESILNVDSKRSFVREIETLAKYQHPAIVPFIGFCEVNNFGYVYLVEMKNGSLQSFLEKSRKGKRHPNFDNTLKFIISYGVAQSMKFLHDDDIIHRDLKPGNVLLDEELRPMLTDFGTAKKINNAIPINQTLSQTTPTIMAPEFIEDPPTYSNSLPIDVYSYAITLYELWTEVPPFSHYKSCFQIYNAVTLGQRPPIPGSVPDEWKNLITKCWDNSPENRPTFSEICDMLETDKYYTDDMDMNRIKAYKKYLTNSLANSWYVSGVKILPKAPEEEVSQDMENPILTKMRQEAEAGDIPSQFNYIVAQFDGTYGKPNPKESLKYAIHYVNREDATNEENINNTSIIEYYAGRSYSLLEEYSKAQSLLKRSVNHGNSEASFYLAELYFDGKIEQRSHKEMEMYYIRAAQSGVPAAIKKYAYMTYLGTLTGTPDNERASTFIHQGSDLGDPELMYMWAVRKEFGLNTEKDVKEAMRLMKLSAEKEFGDALIDYGLHLLNGTNIEKNEDLAKDMFELAASKDVIYGKFYYSLFLDRDEATSKEAYNYLLACLNSSDVVIPEAWAAYGRKFFENNQTQEALPCLYYAASHGALDAFLCLGEICDADPRYGDASFFYQMASSLCHCLGTNGFFSPIIYSVYRCFDCGKIVCAGCANSCHKGHNVQLVDSQCGFKCQCGESGFHDKCSSEFLGETECYQHLYICTTCCPKSDNEYICESCVKNCHKGHKVIDCGVKKKCCACGMKLLPHNFRCKLLDFVNMEKPFVTCSSIAESGQPLKQRWFQCISCGLYGKEEAGICKSCVNICHQKHQILDLGVKTQSCCCRNVGCPFCTKH